MSVIEQHRRFLTVKQLAERWQCSRQTIEKLSRTDPEFPQFFKIATRRRTVRLDEVEAYERGSVVARRAV